MKGVNSIEEKQWMHLGCKETPPKKLLSKKKHSMVFFIQSWYFTASHTTIITTACVTKYCTIRIMTYVSCDLYTG